MANAASVQAKADRLRSALLRRYPGVLVTVGFNDHVADGHGTYKGWYMSFMSADPGLLIKYNLAPPDCPFDSSSSADDGHRAYSELAGVSWYTNGIIDCPEPTQRYGIAYHIEEEPRANARDRALTKTRQAQVLRMLKPFIRGTWKPPQPA
jgi:hypothetical protein